ncbi:magnesium transporter [Actinokineospora bangkokensis]|uniref:Magnesium transporter n=1 Tax=Actinokineospora bangkokensis TaxID=1193682 RepID=A0A1Q9LJT5_9PSEU|nr:magnesium transporter [Actinokineospora bangkokensis]
MYRDGELVEEGFGLDQLAACVGEDGQVAWVDLDGAPGSDLNLVGEQLGLHELAIEDARESRQRPKVDHYRGHLFLTVYRTALADDGELTTTELGIFVTPRALVTVHTGFDMAAVLRRWDTANPPTDRVGVLLHGILDDVVDGHLQTAQAMDEDLDELEDAVFEERAADRDLQRRTVTLRRSLSDLRHVVQPMRELLLGLHRDHTLIDDDLRPWFADIRDHVAHAAEMTDSLREQLTTIRETELNIQSNRLNLIMKKVTGWAAIIAIPTAITGFYGQNVPYPGAEQPWGFWVSTVAILVLSVGLYAMFRRKDWL